MSSKQLPASVAVEQLASIIGENAVRRWDNCTPSQQKAIQQVNSCFQTPPSCIIYPETTEQLARAIVQAHCHRWRLLICGSGSKLSWGGAMAGIDVVVSTERLNQLLDHAIGDLTVTVEAGMKFSQLQSVLAKSNQFLALDPVAPESATIGGIVATANTNSLRERYGGVRDQLLGISFVRTDGQIAKAGGRVVKNVAGYDLMKLFTGSYGTLGVIAQVTFRVYPLPPSSTTVVLTGTAENIFPTAAAVRNCALTPTQADLLSASLVSNLQLGQGPGLIVRFQSIAESVKEQANRLLEIGQKLGLQATLYSATQEVDLWQRLQKSIYSAANNGAIICKIGVLPSAAFKVLTQEEQKAVIHLSSGLGILQWEKETTVERILQMRSLLEANKGFLTILEAPPAIKEKLDVWGYTGNALEIMRRLKAQFDPNNILNPGRFVGGI